MLCTSMQGKQIYIQIIIFTQSRQVLSFRLAWSFVGKYPLEIYLAQPVLVNSNWVIKDLNITDLSHKLRSISN